MSGTRRVFTDQGERKLLDLLSQLINNYNQSIEADAKRLADQAQKMADAAATIARCSVATPAKASEGDEVASQATLETRRNEEKGRAFQTMAQLATSMANLGHPAVDSPIRFTNDTGGISREHLSTELAAATPDGGIEEIHSPARQQMLTMIDWLNAFITSTQLGDDLDRTPALIDHQDMLARAREFSASKHYFSLPASDRYTAAAALMVQRFVSDLTLDDVDRDLFARLLPQAQGNQAENQQEGGDEKEEEDGTSLAFSSDQADQVGLHANLYLFATGEGGDSQALADIEPLLDAVLLFADIMRLRNIRNITIHDFKDVLGRRGLTEEKITQLHEKYQLFGEFPLDDISLTPYLFEVEPTVLAKNHRRFLLANQVTSTLLEAFTCLPNLRCQAEDPDPMQHPVLAYLNQRFGTVATGAADLLGSQASERLRELLTNDLDFCQATGSEQRPIIAALAEHYSKDEATEAFRHLLTMVKDIDGELETFLGKGNSSKSTLVTELRTALEPLMQPPGESEGSVIAEYAYKLMQALLRATAQLQHLMIDPSQAATFWQRHRTSSIAFGNIGLTLVQYLSKATQFFYRGITPRNDIFPLRRITDSMIEDAQRAADEAARETAEDTPEEAAADPFTEAAAEQPPQEDPLVAQVRELDIDYAEIVSEVFPQAATASADL